MHSVIKIRLLLRQAHRRGKSSRAPYKCTWVNDVVSIACYGHEIFNLRFDGEGSILENLKLSCASKMEFDAINTAFSYFKLPYKVDNKLRDGCLLRSNGVYVYEENNT